MQTPSNDENSVRPSVCLIGGGRLLLPEILGQTDRIGVKSPIFYLFSPVASQPQHLAKKVQLTLIGSPLYAFQ